MAHASEIVTSLSVRVNVGNYEGVELFISRKVVMDELDDEAAERERSNLVLEGAMVRRIISLMRTRGKKATAAEVARQYGLRLEEV